MTDPSATLHLVFSAAGLQACQAGLSAGDAIMLLEDGVSARAACDLLCPGRCFALASDLRLRGLRHEHGAVQSVEHDQLVALCVDCARSASWR